MLQSKQKSRLPMPTSNSQAQPQPKSSGDDYCDDKVDAENKKSKSKPSSINPLAKAMEKRQKPGKKGKSSSETWYEEKIESQSQMRYQKTRTDQEKKRDVLLKQLQEAESQVEVLKNLIDERDKLLKDAQEESENKITSLEEKLDESEKTLVANGVDPVTGEKIVPSQDEKVHAQKLEKFTKKKVQAMREKLMKMNQDTESFLADIENTVQYLDSLEIASERMGPLSEETRRYFGDVDDADDIISKVYDENAASGQTEAIKDVDSQDVKDSGVNEDALKSQIFITRHDTPDDANP